ncbi:hypothetical protein CFOL_v3_07478 [Cephalotus follicularis]|uniref:Uncharacterized protein n=1 Tax=Cephalotus follicularis TaxID=3775 RepID=A0A1Q3B7M5_CEPFO|nr:hypothetical protein CFOL_v3_07478 [Cephalotus follicularis]
METTNSAIVQHVTKKSSDELLRKFAEVGDNERKELRVSKRIKKSRTRREGDYYESPSNGSTSLVERRSLLLPPVKRRLAFLRQLGIGRSQLRVREIKNRSLLVTIEKTWHKTVQGASKVFLEKHCNRHRRLMNDVL